MQESFTLSLKRKALLLGFDDVGVAQATDLPVEAERLQGWLAEGAQAGMAYMERNADKRVDPQLLLEGAQSVVVVLVNYTQQERQAPHLPQVATFSYGNDYHDLIREKLSVLIALLKQHYPQAAVRGFVDTAPILERAWAVRAGLGWVGKNNLLISPRFGSCTFLATLVTDVVMEYDKPFTQNHCGDCCNCLSACPTGALCKPYFLDARKCVSYHTIESKEPVTIDTRGYIFGCDRCQLACPWNKQTCAHTQEELKVLPELLSYTAKDWQRLTEPEFNRIFAHSPLRRAGLAKLKETINLPQISQIDTDKE